MLTSHMILNPFTPRRDEHVTSPYNNPTVSSKHDENIQTYQLDFCYPHLTSNSRNSFTRKSVRAREEN